MLEMIPGGNGFLGKSLRSFFPDATVPNGNWEIQSDAARLFAGRKINLLINACGRVGGIGYNKSFPADIFQANLRSGLNLMEHAKASTVDKFVQIGTVCSYPENCSIPMSERDFWNGYPEETNASYGIAKKALITYGQSLNKQNGLNIIFPILANLYGPGDHYGSDNGHVIPSMINKFISAIDRNEKTVTLWGTGECSRQFLYVKDAAAAIRFLVDNYNSPEIINVSSNEEIRIKDLAYMVADICDFRGDIIWDTSKPDGQPRRNFDTSKINKLGWKARTSLVAGLYQTIRDFKEQYQNIPTVKMEKVNA